ncbi:MAG: hypothetical protein IJC76_10615 [Lachnospiraceae bacterium]|nr:hypothetical protein [Lachnospiraceae bacterium]
MRYLNYIRVFSKRLFLKPLYILILFMIPILAFSIKYFSLREDTALNIAIYNEGNEERTVGMTDYLLALDGNIKFHKCSSTDEVYDRVKYRKSDSGFIIPADLSERAEKGVTLGAIACITSPGSTMFTVAKEFVITAFLQTYSFDILLDCTINSGDFSDMSEEQIQSELFDYYNQNLVSDKVFYFNYENDYVQAENISLVPNLLINSAVGIFALFIFITSLAGTITLYKDCSDGVFVLYKPLQKAMLSFLDIAIPTFACYVIIIIASVIGSFSENILIDLIRGLGFIFLCTGICLILKNLIKSSTLFASSLPVLLIGSMLFCPVFIDMSVFIPRLSTLKYLFPVTYYLNCQNIFSSAILLLCGIVFSIIAIIITYRTEKYYNGL